MKTFRKIFLANCKELFRDKTALFWLFAFPLIISLIYGVVFSGNTEPSYEVGIVLPGKENLLAQEIVAGISSIPVFEVTSGSKEEELAALKKGERAVVLSLLDFDPGETGADKGIKVPIYFDSGRSTIIYSLLPIIEGFLIDLEFEIIGHDRMISLQPQPVQAKQLTNFEYMLPGLLAMALMQLGLFGSLHLLELRETKILRGLSVTPLPREVLLASELLLRLLVALVQATLIILLGKLVFGVDMVGNLLAVAGVVIVGALVFISMGYLLISFARSIDSGNGIIQVTQFPMLILSGVFFPVEILPDYIQPIVRVIPLTYLGDALRQVMVGATSGNSMIFNLLVLGGWLIFNLVLTIKFWRWE